MAWLAPGLAQAQDMTAAHGQQYGDHVEALRAQYGAIPPGQRIRLAKKTSNLFRMRSQGAAPGLDVKHVRRRHIGGPGSLVQQTCRG